MSKSLDSTATELNISIREIYLLNQYIRDDIIIDQW